MPLKTFVKVGSITNLTDARYCAGMGVDMLGFRAIEGQENYIKPTQFQEIRGWVTGPLIVAEVYGIKNDVELSLILENYKPDYLEMGLAEVSLFSTLPLPLILLVEESDIPKNLSAQPHYLISDKPFKTDFPLLIEIHSATEAGSLLTNEQVKGFVLKGSAELKPGLKQFEVMTDVLEMLEVED